MPCENRKVKKLLAEPMLDFAMLKGLYAKKNDDARSEWQVVAHPHAGRSGSTRLRSIIGLPCADDTARKPVARASEPAPAILLRPEARQAKPHEAETPPPARTTAGPPRTSTDGCATNCSTRHSSQSSLTLAWLWRKGSVRPHIARQRAADDLRKTRRSRRATA
jgi:hypothetical protein